MVVIDKMDIGSIIIYTVMSLFGFFIGYFMGTSKYKKVIKNAVENLEKEGKTETEIENIFLG